MTVCYVLELNIKSHFNHWTLFTHKSKTTIPKQPEFPEDIQESAFCLAYITDKLVPFFYGFVQCLIRNVIKKKNLSNLLKLNIPFLRGFSNICIIEDSVTCIMCALMA